MDFYLLQKKFGVKYGKKLVDSATKLGLKKAATEISKNFAKTASKKVLHKASEATGDLIGNKIADKITSMGKPRSMQEKDNENIMEETQEFYIPPEKRKQIIKDLKLF